VNPLPLDVEAFEMGMICTTCGEVRSQMGVAHTIVCFFTECHEPSWIEGYRNIIDRWAAEFGIDPTVLAAIVFHEGGNGASYGDAWRDIEYAAGGHFNSVGIAQIYPETAQRLISATWGEEMSLGSIRTQLIYDDEFSIALSAANVATNRGILRGASSPEALFVAHGSTQLSVEAYRDTGTWRTAALQRRQDVHWPAAVEAVEAAGWSLE
jgi:hypothetical protein